MQPLIDQLEPFPAMVVNARLDLLAYNRVYASFFDDLEAIPIEDRNVLWLVFTHPEMRGAIVDWDDVSARMVAEYRGAMAEHLDDPAWETLVARLQRASTEFAAIWERHDVQGVEGRTKRAMHPTAGSFGSSTRTSGSVSRSASASSRSRRRTSGRKSGSRPYTRRSWPHLARPSGRARGAGDHFDLAGLTTVSAAATRAARTGDHDPISLGLDETEIHESLE